MHNFDGFPTQWGVTRELRALECNTHLNDIRVALHFRRKLLTANIHIIGDMIWLFSKKCRKIMVLCVFRHTLL